MQTVGFIGLGNMGGPVVGHIQRDGFSMVVYDLRPDAIEMGPYEMASFEKSRCSASVSRRSSSSEAVSSGMRSGTAGLAPTGCQPSP